MRRNEGNSSFPGIFVFSSYAYSGFHIPDSQIRAQIIAQIPKAVNKRMFLELLSFRHDEYFGNDPIMLEVDNGSSPQKD
jgi:hypothetical protein